MSLVSLKPLLKDAEEKGYAVGSFNMLSIENVRGAVKAAEELRSPIILQLAQVHLPYAPIEYMSHVMLEAAKRASVPVCVHFDHGTSFESVAKAIRWGFSSVMFDGASLALEENIRLTKEIVKVAHIYDISVEAELGQVGLAENGNTNVEASLTKVADAIKFVDETNVDALAVSIGNLHGEYIDAPHLRFDRLEDINNAVGIPLVLHGGSGISERDFKTSISHGIRKINIATALQQSCMEKIKSAHDSAGGMDYFEVIQSIVGGTYEAVKKHIHIFGSGNMA